MIKIAHTYLGNLQENSELVQQLASSSKPALEVYLNQEEIGKGRIQVQSTSDITVGIIKGRDWLLRSGDIFVSESGELVRIYVQEQKLMVLSFDQSMVKHAAALVYLGHVLGNHHYPLTIEHDKLYLQLVGDSQSMEQLIKQTIKDLQISGLQINYESRSPNKFLSFSHHHH